jgi:hypothetical protein
MVRENPNLEKRLINEIVKVCASHKVVFHAEEYLELVAHGKKIIDKNDKKSKTELGRLFKLKGQCIENMPKIAPEEEKSYSFISHNNIEFR